MATPYSTRNYTTLMGWTAPASALRVPRWELANSLTRMGVIRHERSHNRARSGQERVPSARRRCHGKGCRAQETAPLRGDALLRELIAMPGRHGGLRERPLLGTRTQTAWAQCEADAASIRAALCEDQQERCG